MRRPVQGHTQLGNAGAGPWGPGLDSKPRPPASPSLLQKLALEPLPFPVLSEGTPKGREESFQQGGPNSSRGGGGVSPTQAQREVTPLSGWLPWSPWTEDQVTGQTHSSLGLLSQARLLLSATSVNQAPVTLQTPDQWGGESAARRSSFSGSPRSLRKLQRPGPDLRGCQRLQAAPEQGLHQLQAVHWPRDGWPEDLSSEPLRATSIPSPPQHRLRVSHAWREACHLQDLGSAGIVGLV